MSSPNEVMEDPYVATSEKPRTDPHSGKLSKKEKIAYGVGSSNDAWGNWLLPGIVWPVFNAYLGVATHLISIALMFNRLFDAISDPLFGWASDNARTKWGRRRPFILVGSVLSGIGMMAFFWLIQPDWHEKVYFWYLLLSSGILITLVSCFNMPYQSLGAEMTPDYEERTSVFAYRGGFQKLAEIGNFGAAAFITLSIFNGDILWGSKIFGTIIGTLMILSGCSVFFGTKERYYANVTRKPSNKVGIIEAYSGALKCKPFRTQLAMAVTYGTCTSMIGTLGFYTTVFYVCGGDWALGGKWNLAMGASMVLVGFAGIPFFSKIAHMAGKRSAMILVLFLSIIAYASTWFLYNPNYPYLQLITSGFNAFTMAGFWMLYGAIGADVIDYDELETGKRREGAFTACGSFFMKIGLAIGIGAPGFILKWIGFDEALGGNQAENTLVMMRIFLAAIPIAGLLVALVFLLRFQLTKAKSEEIRTKLEERRGYID
ncbi:glycoside/pentoside/hexuronide:cation symporter, GPH family [Rubritalea squalenifaciens DSM 18772]|uniref:Glycoside/pentoside/hexuronide:cation symporter, GPH family n=2 Tax=Rubritalea squalenifaciens TaxID=407226 RepID=A0A1M6IRS6_9BACT|nr:glycoside/pentoside/hexuronide:cation symporter, GPH family [Rubritalea squalenifaciens DSM 18772]